MAERLLLTFHSPANPLIVALRAAGQEVAHVEDFRAARARLDGCSAYYGNLFTEIKYPAAFLRLQRALRGRGVPYVFWNRDAPWNVGMKRRRALFLRLLKPVDIYLAHSMQDAAWFSNDAAIYFPNAARPEYYADTDLGAMREPASYQHDVCFIGALGNLERRACRERVAFLDALRRSLGARHAAPRLCVVDTVRNPLAVAEQLRLIRRSKINLNYGAMCDLPGKPSWGLPERAFGIPAAGGFLLTEWRRSIPETFGDDACDAFRDADDCAAKIVHYLSHFDLLRERAEALHRVVTQHHTYELRAHRLLQLLEKWRRDRKPPPGVPGSAA